MKKSVFIIIGGLIVTILVAVWGYLFFFGSPESVDEVYSDLGLQGEVDTSTPIELVAEEVETPVVNLEQKKLRQLTTKQVAGFSEVGVSTSTPGSVYYVEMGTGHIFSINLTSGEEVRVSGTTVPKAYKADITPDGRFAAIATLNNTKDMELFLLEMGTSSTLTLEEIGKTITDFTIGSDNALMYSSPDGQGLSAVSYNLSTKKISSLFSVPFREASIDWGDTVTSPHYVFPKAASSLEGYLYQIVGGKFSRLPLSGSGFSAAGNSDMVIYNKIVNREAAAYVYDLKSGESRLLSALVIPEKCFLPTEGFNFVCPFDSAELPLEFPDAWYNGSIGFKDSIWKIDGLNMAGESLIDTYKESSRELDIIDMKVSAEKEQLYFINKNDNTLWMYEI